MIMYWKNFGMAVLDWAVMICLVGLGQDIYDGEVGINEWFRCGIEEYQNWELFYSPAIFNQTEDKDIDKDLLELYNHKNTADRIWKEIEFCKLAHELRPHSWELDSITKKKTLLI